VGQPDDGVDDDAADDQEPVEEEHQTHKLGSLPLYLTEEDVESVVTVADALDAVEASFRRLAAGTVENQPRARLRVPDGVFAVMAAVDEELGLAGLKAYAWVPAGTPFAVLLFDVERAELRAVIEADRLGQLRTGAASGVAAKYLARPDARSLGVIGCGWQAESQVRAIREALPGIERVVAYCRTRERLEEFCRTVDAEPGESHRDAGEQDVVVTATTSSDPVLRGEWLRAGALVCAIGANRPKARELDDVVLQRAQFVCCDSREQARHESGDLIEPIEHGVLDWLEVHELQEVVAGELPGRQSPDDIVVFKSNGIAAWDVAIAAVAVERAREQGVGREL
jgi:alanine dehydrogenase